MSLVIKSCAGPPRDEFEAGIRKVVWMEGQTVYLHWKPIFWQASDMVHPALKQIRPQAQNERIWFDPCYA